MTETGTEARPAAEPKTGWWVALTHLSVARRDDKDKGSDLVESGGRVQLTEEESRGFLARHRIPVIRPAGEEDSGRRIIARDLFGKRPGPPAGVSPDPADQGSRIVTIDPDPSDVDLNADGAGRPGNRQSRQRQGQGGR